jgi:hypothetical protein
VAKSNSMIPWVVVFFVSVCGAVLMIVSSRVVGAPVAELGVLAFGVLAAIALVCIGVAYARRGNA